MGTGLGILAEAAMENTKNVIAADINAEAVSLARAKGISSVRSDLFSDVQGKFDLIIFNPPYLPEDNKEDEESRLSTTGGKKGHEILERFLAEAAKHLKDNGKILIIASSLTGDVEKIMAKYSFKFKCLEQKKLFFEKLYVYLLNRSGDI